MHMAKRVDSKSSTYTVDLNKPLVFQVGLLFLDFIDLYLRFVTKMASLGDQMPPHLWSRKDVNWLLWS